MNAPRRPVDESMTLLREAMDRPLDPGYAAAAARRESQRHAAKARQGRRHLQRPAFLTGLLAMAAGFGLAASVAVVRQPADALAEVRRDLQARIEQRSAALDEQVERNARLRLEVATARQLVLGDAGESQREQERRLGAVAGALPVRGPGVSITLDDAPSAGDDVGGDPRVDAGTDGGVVIDLDVQVVVNGLWAAGAEAVAVNGQRLSALSANRSAGRAILVDFRPLSPPYRIDAVGDPAALQTRFAAGAGGPYVASLRDNNGIGVATDERDELALPASGRLTLRSAAPPGASR